MGEHELRHASVLPAAPDTAFRWHLASGALTRLTPGFRRVVLVDEPRVEAGARGELRVGLGPLALRWIARIAEVDRVARRFVDEQERGPFASWRHVHSVEACEDPATSRLVDEVTWRAPGGALGSLLLRRKLQRDLSRLFAWRHRVVHHDLAAHARAQLAPMRVAVTGASGLVGRALVAFLRAGGHDVVRLVRRTVGETRPLAPDEAPWDPHADPARAATADAGRLEGLDAVVHLAGEPVFGLQWTAAKRARIRRSRVEGSRALVARLAALAAPPKVFVSASAVGYYGDRGDEWLTEESPPGAGFLPDTCAAWEAETSRAAAFARVVQLRLGVVLDAGGGALRVMLPAFAAGLGGPLGSGRHHWPWVALDDVLGAVLHSLATETLAGPANLVAPGIVRQREFAAALGRTLRRPAVVPVPRFALRGLLGRGQADEMLLASARVRPERLLASGFRFAYPGLDLALAHVLGRSDASNSDGL